MEGKDNKKGGLPLAHVRQSSDGFWEFHGLEEHLRAVAHLAGEFAEPLGNGDWAALAGLWHDLTTYRVNVLVES